MSIKKLSLSGLVLLLTIGTVFSQGLLRNSVTTNAFPKVFPNANDVLIWDGVKQIWTNGTATVSATNAIADINGSTSNHQFLVIWNLAETSNTFGIQTLQGSTGGTNYFHFPTADTTHSGVLSSNDWTSFSNIALTNVDATQFAIANKILYFRVGAMTTNLNANGFTNRGPSLFQGNVIAGTNGWVLFGDSVNIQAFTNYMATFQKASMTMDVPGTRIQMVGTTFELFTNSAIMIGGTSGGNTTNTIRFSPEGFIFDSPNAPSSATEINAYRFANNNVGWHSNDVVRRWEMTNAISGFSISVDTNSMMNSNQVLYAQRQFGNRNIFYDDFNYPTLIGNQFEGRTAYGTNKYRITNSVGTVIPAFNTGGLLRLSNSVPAPTQNFYLSVTNAMTSWSSNITRVGCSFVPTYDGVGANLSVSLGMILAHNGNPFVFVGDTNIIHCFFNTANGFLDIERGCCALPAYSLLHTNVYNGDASLNNMAHFWEYSIAGSNILVNFDGMLFNIYDSTAAQFFTPTVAIFELSGGGTNSWDIGIDSIWWGYNEQNYSGVMLTDAANAGVSIRANQPNVQHLTNGTTFNPVKTFTAGSGVVLTDRGTNILIDASAGSPGFMAQNTNIASQPNVSFWPGANVTITTTNNTASNRVDYVINSTSGGSGGGLIQIQTNNAIVINGTNVNFFAIAPLFLFGTNNAASNKADLQFQVNTTGTGNNFAMQGAPTLSNTVTIVGTIGGQAPELKLTATNGNAAMTFTLPANWKPTNSLSFTITNPVPGQNIRISGVSQSGGISTMFVTNDFTKFVSTPTTVGTNLIFDGSISDTYEVFVASSGLTNFIFTNIQQLVQVDAWVTNGTTVNLMYDFYNLFTAGQYYDQAVIPVDTNGPTRITVWRTSRGTNVLVQTRTYSLIPGANITFTTNAVNGTVSVAGNAGGGGGGPFNITQFDASGTVTNIKDGAVLTNMQFYGATTRNYGTNLMNWIWLTNQLFYAPIEYNGSNGVTALATTNMWDLTSQTTFRSVTNFVGTNLFFIITNVTKSASLISSFIGNGSYSNNVAILAQSGVNIKWMNWQTNGNYDLLIRPNATYTLQGFAERATNIIMWVSTDDSYVPFFAWTAGVSNLTATNLNVTAGQSTSNFFPAGPMFKLLAPAPSAFTNLNGTITTFTNAMAFNAPAHTLTNNGDATILIWRGFMLAGTNNLRVVYGSHIWDPGPFTNANTAFEAGMEVTKVAGPGGFTNQLVDAWIDFRNYGALPVTNSVGGFRTNYNAWQTNGIVTSNILQVASRATGAFSNNFLKVIYEPGPR